MKTIRFVSLALLPVLAIAFCGSDVQARIRFKVIHSFAGGDEDGANPYGGVAPDGSGGFYVATDIGGIQNSGTLMHLPKKGAPAILHSFLGNSDGQNADSTPILSTPDGVVVGTTQFGGGSGCGTVYEYFARVGGYESFDFGCAPADGAFPFGGVSQGAHFIVGTTYRGGSNDDGTLFLLGHVQKCSFSGADGSLPYGGVVEADFVSDYAYYVAASAGGSSNLGTVTQFDKDCNERVLHNFAGGSDGASPYGTLAYDGGFFLYGTTRFGGGPNLGTVFKMDISGGNYTVLHTFQGICCGNSDGSFPFSGLTLNPKDKMYYGTTINGGGPSDNGTVYKIDPNTGGETVVHAFTGGDGAHPYAGLYIDPNGKVYGTTLQGGAHNLGVVFRLKT